jgi:hypothetical protein
MKCSYMAFSSILSYYRGETMNKYVVKMFNRTSRKETVAHYMGHSVDSVVWHLMNTKHPNDIIKSVMLV